MPADGLFCRAWRDLQAHSHEAIFGTTMEPTTANRSAHYQIDNATANAHSITEQLNHSDPYNECPVVLNYTLAWAESTIMGFAGLRRSARVCSRLSLSWAFAQRRGTNIHSTNTAISQLWLQPVHKDSYRAGTDSYVSEGIRMAPPKEYASLRRTNRRAFAT